MVTAAGLFSFYSSAAADLAETTMAAAVNVYAVQEATIADAANLSLLNT
jgi:hypothetical protein